MRSKDYAGVRCDQNKKIQYVRSVIFWKVNSMLLSSVHVILLSEKNNIKSYYFKKLNLACLNLCNY